MTIKAVAITNSTGEVFQMWMPGTQDYPSEGAWSEDNSCTVHHVADQNDHATFMATRYWKDGAWQAREANTKPYYVWKDYKWELDSDALWVEIRRERDNLLILSDWTQLPDCTLTNVQINDWKIYRQSLRDVPTTQSSVTGTHEVLWPAKPS
jgi:hypothetical protein